MIRDYYLDDEDERYNTQAETYPKVDREEDEDLEQDDDDDNDNVYDPEVLEESEEFPEEE